MTDREDRFGDLGAGEERRSVGERLEERDRTHPEPVERPPETRRPSSRYAWVIGIAFLIVIVVAGFNSLPNEGRGLLGPEPRSQLAPFSTPLATSRLEGDANLCRKRPCPKNAGPVPACDVRSSAVLNVCELWRRPLVLTFVFDRAADCFPQVDRVERMRREVPEVNFAVVYFSRKDRSEVREIVLRRRWSMPVGHDRDGAVVNRYGIGGCPTTVFAYRGGEVRRTRLGSLTEAQLRDGARRLIRRRGA